MSGTNPQVIPINAYSFHEALEKIQPYLKPGFSFDFVSNENYPRSFGTQFVFALLERKPIYTSAEYIPDTAEQGAQEDKPIKVRGRTKKEPE